MWRVTKRKQLVKIGGKATLIHFSVLDVVISQKFILVIFIFAIILDHYFINDEKKNTSGSEWSRSIFKVELPLYHISLCMYNYKTTIQYLFNSVHQANNSLYNTEITSKTESQYHDTDNLRKKINFENSTTHQIQFKN